MLEAIRNRSNGPIAKFIIGLIIIPFAFAGVYSYFNTNTSNVVATVNGEDISLAEFDRSYRRQQQQWGENFDTYFNTDQRLQQFRINVLQQLINQRLSTQAIKDMGLRISDNKLRKLIMENTDFHDVNGAFDEDQYELILRTRGYSPALYQSLRKNDLASNQFMQVLQFSNFVLKNELDLNVRLQNQTRDINYLIIPQDYYSKQIDLTGEEGDIAIISYYELNKKRFAIAEKVSVEYIYLSRREATSIIISEGQILDYYNENISNYEINERRHLAHILVSLADDDQQSVDAAEKKINEFASRISAGESFEAIAIEGSDDSSTAESGGDLDWIEIGMMDQAFEDAAFALKESNSISAVVKSNFGFHLIKLLEVSAAGAQPIEVVKEQILTTLQNQFVEDKFFELKDKASENAFEISDSLSEAAAISGLLIKTTELFQRQVATGLPAELQNEPAIIDSAFSDEVLYQSLNSELIELSDGNAVILRLLKHQEAGTSVLEDVREQVVKILTNQRSRDASEKVGNQIIAALRDSRSPEESLIDAPEDLPAVWQQQLALTRQGTEIDAQLRNEIFRIPAPTDENSVHKGILLWSGDYAVVSLLAVNQGEIVDEKVESELLDREKQFTDYHFQAEIYTYLKYLDENASISRSIANASLIE